MELNFDFFNSNGLTDIQKKRISLKLGSKLTKDGLLLLQCDDARSQHKNKSLVIDRFFDLLDKALLVQKKRKPTKPSKSSIEKRLRAKKISASKKVNRKKPEI